MLRKLKVALLDVGRNEYLQSFGVKKRRPDLHENESFEKEREEIKKGAGSRYEEPLEESQFAEEAAEKKSEEAYENEEFEGEAAAQQEQPPPVEEVSEVRSGGAKKEGKLRRRQSV